RERRDQMDRQSLRSCHTTHICHCEGGLPTAAIQGRDQMDRQSLRSCHTTHICHCEGGLPTAAIQGRDQMDRHVAALLAMTGGGEVHGHHYPTARRWSELSR